MILSLCLLLPSLSPSSQEICSAPGTLLAPSLYLSQMFAWQGDSVGLQCSVTFRAPATRIIFCKDGEEVSSQKGVLGKLTYDYDHAVSGSGNYSCGYEIKDSNSQVTRSHLSPAKHLSITGSASSSGGGEEPTPTGPVISLTVWATRCTLVLVLLVSAPVITFMLEKRGLAEPAGLEETPGGSSSIMGTRGLGMGEPH